MTSRNRQDANFDRIARAYRWMEYLTFGRALERCRGCFLEQLANQRSALVLGDGDGRFAASLLAANPQLEADAVDSSSAMLRLLIGRVQSAALDTGLRLRTHQGCALDFEFAEERRYDLVATHFFLDCLTQPELHALCARIAPRLEPGALWVVSDFRIPDGAMRWPALALVRSLYFGFRVLTGLRTNELPDHMAALNAAGFVRVAQQYSLGGILTAEMWQLGAKHEYTAPMMPVERSDSHKSRSFDDPLPDPEPVSPSLPGPDPGVFHHEPFHPEPAEPYPVEPEPKSTGGA